MRNRLRLGWVLILLFTLTASAQRPVGSQVFALTPAETVQLLSDKESVGAAQAGLRRAQLRQCEAVLEIETKYGVKPDIYSKYDETGRTVVGKTDRCESYRGPMRGYYMGDSSQSTKPYFTYDYKYLVRP